MVATRRASTASKRATRRRSCEVVRKAKVRCKLEPAGQGVHSCYEAGRDGWWLHRWLIEHGVDNIVVDSASIEVNRRARRAKTDRLDGVKLLAMLLRHHGGERVWSVLHEPTAEDEDGRRAHRELARLMHERTQHTQPHRLAAGAAQPAPAHHHRRPRLGCVGGTPTALQVPPGAARRARARERTAGAGQAADQGAGSRAAPGAGGRQAADGGAACPAARDRDQGRLGAGQGAVRLAALRQSARAGRLPGAGTHAVRQRRQPGRARHQQGRQQASAGVAGGARLGLAAIAARRAP